jgi:fimbrial chaperone protein
MVRLLKTVLTWSVGGLSLWAGSFKVSPVRIELSARRPHTTVAVTNLSKENTTIQVQVLRWMAKGSGEAYAETEDLLLNPPIFTLAPGQSQHMRLGLRKAHGGSQEVSYRLIMEEIPRPSRPGVTGITTLLRISVPVFIRPATKAAPDLTWRLAALEDGKLKLSVENRGPVHVQLKRMGLSTREHPEPDRMENVAKYVLPGGSREWTIRDERLVRETVILVKTETDQGDHSVSVSKDTTRP